MITVLHMIRPEQGSEAYEAYRDLVCCMNAQTNVPILWGVGGYEKRAEINTDNLGAAYSLTQNVDKPWCKNPHITAFLGDDEGIRSSQCGDLLLLDGKYYMVDRGAGFTLVYPEGSNGEK